jgi:1-deoxy-D-xylulose-5-phosphate reductoisomerase
MRRVLVLGSTGSIGKQTLEVIQRLPERLQVVGLATYRDYKTLLGQAQAFGVRALGLLEPPNNGALLEVRYRGVEGLCAMAQRAEVDVVVVALGGAIALQPTIAALQAGKTVALATKEVLVAAGEAVMTIARQHNAPILPIDSEHSGAFQAMHAGAPSQVARLVLTASGGPFRTRPLHTFDAITVEEALQHPNWDMGAKITVDSATMMNKGLEVIEAQHLFGLRLEQVEVLIHPQSIVHALVEFVDGSVIAQLSLPDMRLPIEYALLYPDRADIQLPRLRLEQVGQLTFEAPDPCALSVSGVGVCGCAHGRHDAHRAERGKRGRGASVPEATDIRFMDIPRLSGAGDGSAHATTRNAGERAAGGRLGAGVPAGAAALTRVAGSPRPHRCSRAGGR